MSLSIVNFSVERTGHLREPYGLRVIGDRLAIVAYLPQGNVEANSSIDLGRILSTRLAPLSLLLRQWWTATTRQHLFNRDKYSVSVEWAIQRTTTSASYIHYWQPPRCSVECNSHLLDQNCIMLFYPNTHTHTKTYTNTQTKKQNKRKIVSIILIKKSKKPIVFCIFVLLL